MDLFGPMPTTNGGMKYVLVFKCALTKWVELFALKSKDMEAIAECFVDEIVMRHGAPRILVTDGGKEFINRALLSICKLLKVRKVTTSPYNPRADGLAENQVKTTKDMLSGYCNAFQNDWDRYLSIVAHYYRTTYNDAIGMTPYFAMYGRECTNINTMWIRDQAVDFDNHLPSYVEDISAFMVCLWESLGLVVHENAQRMQRKHKIHKLHEFKVGDLVMVKRVPKGKFVSDEKVKQKKVETKIRSALQDRYRGPFRIVKRISTLTFICQINGIERSVFYTQMKPFRSRAEKHTQEPDLNRGAGNLSDSDSEDEN